MDNEIKNIEINKIKINENSRVVTKKEDVTELMESIKQHGQKQPIGVYQNKGDYVLIWGSRRLEANKKLGNKIIEAKVYNEPLTSDELLIVNLTENIQRKNISLSELGRIAKLLIKQNYSIGEIASKLSVNSSRIKTAIDMYNRLPAKYQKKVIFADGGEVKKGNISSSAAVKLASIQKQFHLDSKDFEQLMDYAIKKESTQTKLRIIASFIQAGMNIKKAIRKHENYIVVRVDVPVLIKQYDDLKEKYNMSVSKIMTQILLGKLKDKVRL